MPHPSEVTKSTPDIDGGLMGHNGRVEDISIWSLWYESLRAYPVTE